MNDVKLKIAMELIETLAKVPCTSIGSVPDNRDIMAVKRIIEAARSNYVLPSFCAEMNTKAVHCVACIVEHNVPEICRKKIDDPGDKDQDIEWNCDEG